MNTRIDRISVTDIPRVDYLEPLVPDDRWFESAMRRVYIRFLGDAVEVVVEVLP